MFSRHLMNTRTALLRLSGPASPGTLRFARLSTPPPTFSPNGSATKKTKSSYANTPPLRRARQLSRRPRTNRKRRLSSTGLGPIVPSRGPSDMPGPSEHGSASTDHRAPKLSLSYWPRALFTSLYVGTVELATSLWCKLPTRVKCTLTADYENTSVPRLKQCEFRRDKLANIFVWRRKGDTSNTQSTGGSQSCACASETSVGRDSEGKSSTT